MKFIMSILLAIAFFFASGSTPSFAHVKDPSAAIKFGPIVSESGLEFEGEITCSTIRVNAIHPDGERALLLVIWTADPETPVVSLLDFGSNFTAWENITPTQTYIVRLLGSEDGDSINMTVTAPNCLAVDPPNTKNKNVDMKRFGPITTISGLELSGVIDCKKMTVHATHPNGERALLLIVAVDNPDVALVSTVDYGSSIWASIGVTPGHSYRVSIGGAEDGDSIRYFVTAPTCEQVKKPKHHWWNYWHNKNRMDRDGSS